MNAGDKGAGPVADSPLPPSSDLLNPTPTRTAFIGVTHELTLTADAAQTPRCKCMAAVIGQATDPAFAWQGKAPTVGDEAFVLAISSEGTPCATPVGGRGPSIQGVEVEGANIVVHLEEAGRGIPLARGAIIQKAASDEGYLVFRAAGRLPYDDALPGSNDPVCRIRLNTLAAPAADKPRPKTMELPPSSPAPISGPGPGHIGPAR